VQIVDDAPTSTDCTAPAADDVAVADAVAAPPAPTDGTPIDQVDRSAHDDRKPVSGQPDWRDAADDVPELRGAHTERTADADQRSLATRSASDEGDAGRDPTPLPARGWRWGDPLEQDTGAGAQDKWQPGAEVAATSGALHASLALVSQRRLQMVEAMASFSAENAASLELRPHRRIDPATAELLTPVSLTRNVA
jgi:hypothetical protein